MYLFLWTRCSQHASLTRDPLLSTKTPVTKELVSTHMVSLCRQSPCAFWWRCSLAFELGAGPVLLHPSQSLPSLLVISHVVVMHTGRCPVNFPHREKILQQVSMLGIGGSSLLCLHWSLPYSFQICKHMMWVPFFSCFRLLLVSPNCFRRALMQATGQTLSLTNMSSM